MRTLSISASAVALLAVGLTGCAREDVVQGECRDVFGGDVCTWGTMVGDQVSAFGATVALASIENAPTDVEMVFPPPFVGVVPLPPDVAAATGFDHLGVNWEPHGHPPSLFLTPHFDFHFYTIDPDRVGSIACADLSKPAELPNGYTLPDMDIPGLGMLTGLCVPNMGMHAMVEDELDDTEPFDASMILGYYQTGLIVLEPMIAQATLLEAKSFAMDVPAVSHPDAPAMWPTTIEASYDEASRTYRFIFAGFQSEQGE